MSFNISYGARRIETPASETLSVRRSEQDKILRWAFLESFNTALETGCVYLQFVTIGIQKVQRVAFAVILLPSGCAGIGQTRTKWLEVGFRYGECNVVISQIQGTIGEVHLERKAKPKITRCQVCTSVPARHWFQSKNVGVEDESAVQIGYRQREVIQARNHTQKANTDGCGNGLIEVLP
jgi:hypothetical protein